MKMTLIFDALNLSALDLQLTHTLQHPHVGEASQRIRAIDEQARFDAGGDLDHLVTIVITISPRIPILVTKPRGPGSFT
jgi:hypothetical protein